MQVKAFSLDGKPMLAVRYFASDAGTELQMRYLNALFDTDPMGLLQPWFDERGVVRQMPVLAESAFETVTLPARVAVLELSDSHSRIIVGAQDGN